jgi:hypothetical protein
MIRPGSTTFTVDPSRLASGVWSHEFNETVGEGDIAASYCADTIALHNRVRTPFVFQGTMWVTTSRGGGHAESYRLVPLDNYKRISPTEPVTFGAKIKDCEAARADPLGFYHGVALTHRKDWYVLCGPPVTFVPGQVTQPGLFGDL